VGGYQNGSEKKERWDGTDWIYLPQNTDEAGARV